MPKLEVRFKAENDALDSMLLDIPLEKKSSDSLTKAN